jgi:Predicted rRNA methylase (SpoU class)
LGGKAPGVPNKVHKIANEKLKIPMAKNKRSLNLATSVGIVLAEQIRQITN